MVRELQQEKDNYRFKLFNFRGTHDNNAGRHANNLSAFDAIEDHDDDSIKFRGPLAENEIEKQQKVGCIFGRKENNRTSKSHLNKDDGAGTGTCNCQCKDRQQPAAADMELMKERFAKLLLGEDMSGGGKGVSSALALSNAITNLAASVFGEQRRLEPMAKETKKRWRREIDWVLSVTDHIVEFVASQQQSKDGRYMEIMVTRQRTDLHMNIPALRKLDAMLLNCLDNFQDQNEFSYVKKDAADSEIRNVKMNGDKWWLPTVKVPPGGLPDMTRKFLQHQKDCVNQVLKAAMSINAQVLAEMEVPDSYIESLPKNGRATLGENIYKNITVEFFDPDQFLEAMDLSSEHKIIDLKNKIEASIIIWKRKMVQKDGKSGWGSTVSLERREQFEERAETILLILKHRFPGTSQSSLDISKIQYNQDVGQAVLESYSRILESLAFTVLSRIADVLHANSLAQNQSQTRPGPALGFATDDAEKQNLREEANSRTLLDFMGWDADQEDTEQKKDSSMIKGGDDKYANKLPNLTTNNNKVSYLQHLGGQRSPTSRH